ncbi:MAG: PAS domain S-box protein [Desulfomonile sp.]|nr:PAS domain S-box protein [Desulfomonile sp.]
MRDEDKTKEQLIEELDRLRGRLASRERVLYAGTRTDHDVDEGRILFGALFETSHAVILLIDPDTGRIVGANPGAAEFYGYRREELARMKVTQIHALSVERESEQLARAKSEGRRSYHSQHRLADGTVRDVQVCAGPMTLRGKTFLYNVCFDITERKRAEEHLKQSEKRFRALVEHIPAITYVAALNEKSTILYMSPQVQVVLGVSQDDFSASPDLWWTMLHPEDRDRVIGEVARCRSTGDRFVSEYRMIARSGAIVWFRDEAVIVRQQSGVPAYRQGIMLDMTEARRAEEVMLEGTTRYRALFDNMSNGVFILAVARRGTDFILIDCNKAAEEIYGLQRTDILGGSVLKVIPHVKESGLFAVFQKVWRTGAADRHTAHTFGEECVDEWREHFVYKLPSGEIVTIFTDDTERKLMEEELRKRTRQLTERVRELRCLYGVSDLLQRHDLSLVEKIRRILNIIPPALQYPNIACARVKLDGEEFATKNFKWTPWRQAASIEASGVQVGMVEVCYLEERPEFDVGPFLAEECQLLNDIADRIGRAVEHSLAEEALRTLMEDLERRVFESTGELRAANARLLEEISERTRAMEVLVRREPLKAAGELVGGVADDITNLLQLTVDGVRMASIRLGEGDYSDVRTYLDQVLQSAKMGQDAVRRLETFVGLRLGRPPEETVFDFSLMVRQAVEMGKVWLSRGARRSAAPVDVKVDVGEDCMVRGIHAELFTVVLSLMKNAVEALPGGGEIHVRTSREKDRVVLRIRDNGVGIAKENLSRIFDPFFTTKGTESTGMGLASSSRIIVRHGGEIAVESAERKGTMFSVMLPYAQARILGGGKED